MFQIKEDKSSETEPKETESNDLPRKELKTTVVKTRTEVRRVRHQQRQKTLKSSKRTTQS